MLKDEQEQIQIPMGLKRGEIVAILVRYFSAAQNAMHFDEASGRLQVNRSKMGNDVGRGLDASATR